MTCEQWCLISGLILTIAVAFAPWMLMVHAKLAVIASQVAELCEKIENAAQANQKLWELCARHEARLDTHDVQISYISQRLRDIADN
mgnify:CR=1 FL=1